jgi:hypothetical protein
MVPVRDKIELLAIRNTAATHEDTLRTGFEAVCSDFLCNGLGSQSIPLRPEEL